MSDQQVKEFFTSVLEGGPADRLDLDRAVAAGRRRRRMRTATTLGSAAAVLVLVGALVVSVLPDDGRADLGGATLSPTPSATASSPSTDPEIIAGTADDWARALEPYLPAGTETPAVSARFQALTSLPSHDSLRATFRFERQGRSTALVVMAYADVPEKRSPAEVVAARIAEFEQSCDGTTITCDARVATNSGPVFIRRWADGSRIAASSVRNTGVVITVESWNGDADADRPLPLPGSGAPGFSTEEQLAELAELAAAVPLPARLVPAPTPVPTTDAPTAEPSPSSSSSGPEPTPTGTAPTPEPTPTPTPKPAGLVGTVARSECDRVMTFEAPWPRPISGDVLFYVVCRWSDTGGVLESLRVNPQDGARFTDLDTAVRLADSADDPGTCGAAAMGRAPVFAATSDGWFRVQLPEDRCNVWLPQVLDAIAAVRTSS